MFEIFFKYAAQLYRQGTLQLEYPWTLYAATAGAAAILAVAMAGYFVRTMPLGRVDRFALAGMRGVWVALLVFALFSPALVVTVSQPLRGDVVILLDDSQSMRIADSPGEWRGAALRRLFALDSGELSRALAERFPVHHIGFGLTAQRIHANRGLEFASPRSDIANALNYARTRLQETSLGAVVLVSDGGDEPSAGLQSELLSYRAAGISVHTVGIGAARFAHDVEIAAVSLPRRLFPGDMLHAEVTLRQRGAAGKKTTLQIAEEGILLHREDIVVPATHSFTVPVIAGAFSESGTHRLSFTVTSPPDEVLLENNSFDVLVQVTSDPVRILHFEGEPRFEVKFVRRALSGDDSLHLASLVRTAENKYYRVGVASAQQLASGFPGDAQTLFNFDVVILGSVEANLLSAEQQQLLKDFVARRGGALLLLGARQSFAEGGYATSELNGLLPVHLNATQSGFRTKVNVSPTTIGLLHPIVQALLRAAPDATLRRLPPLTLVNPLLAVKPGATVLLQGNDGGPDPFVVLAYQRYGRGTVAALSTRDTWRWQMHSSVPSDDLTHETLWRELLRWLARPVPGRIELRMEPARPVPGERILVAANPLDASFRPLVDADLELVVITPLGDRHTYNFKKQAVEDGWYSTEFTVSEQGLYELQATLPDEQAPVIGRAAIEVFAAGEEFRAAELNESLLRRIAESTGGQYFTAADAADLNTAITALRGDTRIEQRLPLHDAPALFLCIIVLICVEWFYRRRRGLA
ncbi:MAG: glutamine amidotransferase [Gammaproteobacteria bacterium]|nr:glutamine amidotransferase [Gammaproteobacteria bacterium]